MACYCSLSQKEEMKRTDKTNLKKRQLGWRFGKYVLSFLDFRNLNTVMPGFKIMLSNGQLRWILAL